MSRPGGPTACAQNLVRAQNGAESANLSAVKLCQRSLGLGGGRLGLHGGSGSFPGFGSAHVGAQLKMLEES